MCGSTNACATNETISYARFHIYDHAVQSLFSIWFWFSNISAPWHRTEFFCTPDRAKDLTIQMKYIPCRFLFNLMEILIIKQIPPFVRGTLYISKQLIIFKINVNELSLGGLDNLGGSDLTLPDRKCRKWNCFPIIQYRVFLNSMHLGLRESVLLGFTSWLMVLPMHFNLQLSSSLSW